MQKNPSRLVIDTNLWVIYLFSNVSLPLDKLIQNDQVTILFSNALFDELMEVLNKPKFIKYFGRGEILILEILILKRVVFIDVTTQIAICRDPKDDFLLSLAIDGAATHLITGDKDLLQIKSFNDIKIIKVSDYHHP